MALTFALIGVSFMIFLAGCGSAIGTVIAGSTTLGMMKKRPDAFGNGLVLTAVPGTQGLYGFVGFFLYHTSVTPDITLFKGVLIFAAGLMLGITCLVSAINQGKVCANGIDAIGNGHDVFGNTMILAAFPELYAILSLIAVILMKALLNL